MKKTCTYCKREKAIEEFYKHKRNTDGYDTRCKVCFRKRTGQVRDIKKSAPPKPLSCECCGSSEDGKKIKFVCDHDPILHTFRGWLCQSCNLGIGMLGDNQAGLAKATKYLNKKRK